MCSLGFANRIGTDSSSSSPRRFATLVRIRQPHGQCKPVCNGNYESQPAAMCGMILTDVCVFRRLPSAGFLLFFTVSLFTFRTAPAPAACTRRWPGRGAVWRANEAQAREQRSSGSLGKSYGRPRPGRSRASPGHGGERGRRRWRCSRVPRIFGSFDLDQDESSLARVATEGGGESPESHESRKSDS